MKAHCLFEQSGTFKKQFKLYGVEAYDYDIRNDFGETDFMVDLFREIEKAYDNQQSVFYNFEKEDIILAFFPCTRFEAVIPLMFRGESYQQKKWSELRKLETSMKLHDEMHQLYILISKMACVSYQRGLRMVIENPSTPPTISQHTGA